MGIQSISLPHQRENNRRAIVGVFDVQFAAGHQYFQGKGGKFAGDYDVTTASWKIFVVLIGIFVILF
jgi:hypothetical protein